MRRPWPTGGLLHQKQTNIDLKWLFLLHCIQVLGWISPHSLTILQKVFVFLAVHLVDTRTLSQITLWLLPSILFQIHYSLITILSETIQLRVLQVLLHKIYTNKKLLCPKRKRWTLNNLHCGVWMSGSVRKVKYQHPIKEDPVAPVM